ncbi:hypothetical protein [Massilia sp. TSP1-1-2]|uniref:hypothetical protein n=1 Tax=unclassified Massilia TaxID=2609279 RepID=UPI003CE86169
MLNQKALLAGIFAVVAGVGVVFFTRDKPAPVTVAPTPIVVHEQPFSGPRSKAEARAALAALPELKAWSEHLETASHGTVHGALIEYGPTPKVIGAKSYWQFSYVENTPEAARRWESFLVGQDTPDILVEDTETDQPVSLAKWRKDKQPMARKSAL